MAQLPIINFNVLQKINELETRLLFVEKALTELEIIKNEKNENIIRPRKDKKS